VSSSNAVLLQIHDSYLLAKIIKIELGLSKLLSKIKDAISNESLFFTISVQKKKIYG